MLVKKINTPKSTQIKAPITTIQDMNFLVKNTLYSIESTVIEPIKCVFLFLGQKISCLLGQKSR
ncbi:hypothetical protein B0X65_06635 [Helicobacter pylori]|nr:hypothetical protein B0X65_06635 [Helicobacter pylori]